ncbi:SETMR methyltransferase, partial [Acromyrmex heyeri]
MGSQLSAVIADLVMDFLENSLEIDIPFYTRYVDDGGMKWGAKSHNIGWEHSHEFEWEDVKILQRRGRTSTCDARSERPIETATPEIIDKVHGIVLTDRRVKVRELVEATGIKKRPHLAKKKVLFQDNAQVHTCPITKFNEFRYELLPHPTYSSDLASCDYFLPCDFFLFLNLKKWFGGKKFTSNEEVIAKTEAYFAEFDKSYFSEGLKKWQKRWEKCILLKGDYVEK